MPEFNHRVLVKFLRDELVRKVDELGEHLVVTGAKPSAQMLLDLDGRVADYKNLIATGAVTLDILSRMEARQKARDEHKENLPPVRRAGRPRGKRA